MLFNTLLGVKWIKDYKMAPFHICHRWEYSTSQNNSQGGAVSYWFVVKNLVGTQHNKI